MSLTDGGATPVLGLHTIRAEVRLGPRYARVGQGWFVATILVLVAPGCERGSPTGTHEAALPVVAARLSIPRLDWQWSGVGRDYLYILCLVHDETGQALDVSMAIETESCLARDVCWRQAAALPAGALPRDMLMRKGYGYIDFGTRIQGQLTCVAADAHGKRATRSVPICIDGPEGRPCAPA